VRIKLIPIEEIEENWPREPLLPIFQKIGNRLVNVDPLRLYHDRFIMLPINGISSLSNYVLQRYVSEVFEDARLGFSKCDECHKVFIGRVCPECGRRRSVYELVPGSIRNGVSIEDQTIEKIKQKSAAEEGVEWK